MVSQNPGAKTRSLFTFHHVQCTAIIMIPCFLFVTGMSVGTELMNHENVACSGVSLMTTFNATAFWDTEKARVEAIPPNVSILSKSTAEFDGQAFNRTELAFDTPNWVGAVPASLRVRASLLTPSNDSGSLPLLPGVILIHGTGQNRQVYINAGFTYAMLGCAVLVLDLVGHGESSGAGPDANHTIFQGDFNKTSYHYLAFCNGLQAVHVLRSFTDMVDPGKIAITGHSLGGMTSMVVGAIYHDKVALVMPSGMANITCTFPETSILNLVNMTYDAYRTVPASTWQWINPVNYVAVTSYPACCMFIGTNDEYFSYEGIADVWDALQVSTSNKWLQITPNGHHKYPNSLTPSYILQHLFFDGPAPPGIAITRAEKQAGMLERFRVDVTITCPASIERVEICYKYKDIIGEPWRSAFMSPGEPGQWTGIVETPWISSRAACLVKVSLGTGETTWFTSPVIEAGIIGNSLSIISILGIVMAVAIPIYAILISRYKREVNGAKPAARAIARRCYIAENLAVGGSEVLKFMSIGMTWINYGPTLPWSLAYIMNAYFTYDVALKSLAFYFNAVLVAGFLACFIASFGNQLVSGLLNATWPACFVILASALGSSLGSTIGVQLIGPGFYLFLSVSIAQIGIWASKRWYRKKLGIPAGSMFTMLRLARKMPRNKNEIVELAQ